MLWGLMAEATVTATIGAVVGITVGVIMGYVFYRQQDSQPGLPWLGSRNSHLSEHGDRWVTDRWSVPGTYFLTCQLHPEMTLEVRVLPEARDGLRTLGGRRL